MSLTLAQFQLLADRSADEVLLFSPDGRFRYVNAAAAQGLGYTQRELMALTLQHINPAYSPELLRASRQHLGEHPQLVFEVTHVARDGQRLRKEVRTTTLTVDGEALVCGMVRVHGTGLDQQLELRQMTRLYGLLSRVSHSMVHLKTRAELMAAACEAAVDFGFRMAWVGLVDERGVVKPACHAGHEEGYLAELHIDITSTDTSKGPTGTAVREGRLDVCADMLTEARMKPWLEKALLRGYLASAAVPLRCQGRIIGALNLYVGEQGFFSERECQLLTQLGDELSFAFDTFVEREEREQLRGLLEQSRKLESVGRLAGGVAHDFNNYLTVMVNGVDEALGLLPAGSPARLPLEDIQAAAERSVELTQQLLTFARKRPHSPRVLDLNATIDGSLKLLRRFVGDKPGLEWSPGAALWPVKVDPSQLSQVLSNLCLNARDALKEGLGTIRLATHNVTLDASAAARVGLTPGEHVVLQVSDDGQGMTPEVKAHLFEPLFSTKRKGTGLGLATVYGIVKQAGGAITCESEAGVGTTFTLTWPRAVEGVAGESKSG